MPRIDFGSILLIIVCTVLVVIVFITAITNVVNNYLTNSAEASMYSKPSWYDITTTTTTEETTADTEIEGD